MPKGDQQPPGRTPVLKPSSNSTKSLAWITEPATDLLLIGTVLLICGEFLIKRFGMSLQGVSFYQTHPNGIEKVPSRLVFYIEHTLIEQKCPIKAQYTHFTKCRQS